MEALPSKVGRKSSTTTSIHSPYCQKRNLKRKCFWKKIQDRERREKEITWKYRSSHFPLENFGLDPSPGFRELFFASERVGWKYKEGHKDMLTLWRRSVSILTGHDFVKLKEIQTRWRRSWSMAREARAASSQQSPNSPWFTSNLFGETLFQMLLVMLLFFY